MPKGVYIRTKPIWNKGLTKETDIRIYNLTKSSKNKKISEEQRKKISASLSKYYQENPDKNEGLAMRMKKWRKENPLKAKEGYKKLSEYMKKTYRNEKRKPPMLGKISWNKGIHLSKEHKQKISKARIGIKFSEEHKGKISESLKGEKNPCYGKHLSKEHKEKLSQFHKGKFLSEETRNKIRLGNRGKVVSKESREIMSKSKMGMKRGDMNEEHKRKISLGNRGKNHTKEWIDNWREARKGFKHSEETIIKISGENNHGWLGGKSFEPYGLEFNRALKEQIRKRDSYRCQQCFRHQDELIHKLKNGKLQKYKLHIHHIDYNKKNNNSNNLISLCNPCHIQTNFKRENWINYFKDKMEEK